MSTQSSDPFNVSISIFRNRQWIQKITVQNPDNSPIDISQDLLALVIIPDLSSGNADPVLSNKTPSGDLAGGVAVFTFSDSDTKNLVSGAEYRWQYLRQQSTQNNSDVVVAGPLIVQDSPPFPP